MLLYTINQIIVKVQIIVKTGVLKMLNYQKEKREKRERKQQNSKLYKKI